MTPEEIDSRGWRTIADCSQRVAAGWRQVAASGAPADQVLELLRAETRVQLPGTTRFLPTYPTIPHIGLIGRTTPKHGVTFLARHRESKNGAAVGLIA
jgi:hypothetical protein